ncbi:ATP-grasp domain-containing protein [Vibrio sp. MEBiC08052]|uniref:ATP-grasp domain-containing protein n=1 Tax=Vibrio sp. MEBiC08052 TaxID=1761910 RepID=UPI00074076A7|nr:ATP-grasp domain-containing protein [Vibrio sp. MEBiC08052]KUI97647.1 coenzyme F390 synthetase-like protein [Vibrio sp. MEBiC08052]
MPEVYNKDVIVIVDAYTGGKYLINAFQSIGYKVIHVESQFTPDYFLQDQKFVRSQADKTITYDSKLDELVEVLKEYSIKAIIAGSEGAVELADTLNEAIGLTFSNDFSLSNARRDKYVMQQTLKQAGVPSIRQAKVSTKTELSNCLSDIADWPVVIKPLKSAGTDGVSICYSMKSAQEAFDHIIDKLDMFGQTNTSVLCQEFLEGVEYVVNGVARNNNYFFTELYESKKRFVDGNPVYDEQILRYVNDECYSSLTDYTQLACQALGIKNGAFHAEVMLTENGPVLIEVGARVAGGADPYIIEETLGHSQISKLVDAVIRPDFFFNSVVQQRNVNHCHHKQAAYVYMISPDEVFIKSELLPYIKNVPGVISAKYHYKVGDLQPKTVDLLTAPGVIMIIKEDYSSLMATIKEIRQIEKNFYELELHKGCDTSTNDLLSLVQETQEKFPWYTKLKAIDTKSQFTINDLPLIDEQVLTEHYYHVDHEFESADEYLTSGTTSGQRKRILYAPSDQEIYRKQRKKIIQQFCGLGYKTACADLGTGHAAATAGDIFHSMGCETKLIDFTRPINEHIEILNRFNPEIFFTMPMILDALIATGELTAKPKKIIVLGDVASFTWQEKVADFFDITTDDILDLLGSIEIGSIAFFNHDIGRYQFDDYIFPEVMDANSLYPEANYTGPGKILLLTSFARKFFPAIRFVTNDLIEDFQSVIHDGRTIYTFKRCLGRYSGEFKHGEKINLSDITAAIAMYSPYKAYDLDDSQGGLVIRIADSGLSEYQKEKIKSELFKRNPDIFEMISSGLVGDIEIIPVSEEEINCTVSKRRYKS